MSVLSTLAGRRTIAAVLAGTVGTVGLGVIGAAGVGLAGPASAAPARPADNLPAVQAAGAAAIAMRHAQLAKLAAELAKAPSCDTNGSIASEIAADGPALTAVGTKLAAETTLPPARADFQSIFDTFRVYLVVTPQAYVTAACGHVQSAAARLTADQQKLAVRVAALPAGAAKDAATASLADLSRQLTSATSLSTAAATSLGGIRPDLGNKAIQASNAAVVSGARAQLVTVRSDLLTAVNDAKAVVADLKSGG